MTQSLPLEYDPNPIPTNLEDIPRFLFDELNRIKTALYSQPVALTVTTTFTVDVTTVVDWQRMFIGADASWDVPGGNWDPVNGEYNVPKSGLYQIFLDGRINPFGAGNKTYYAGVAILHWDASESTLRRMETTDGGDDSIPLGVTMAVQLPLGQGDRVYFENTVVHDQFTGTTTVDASVQLLYVSAG